MRCQTHRTFWTWTKPIARVAAALDAGEQIAILADYDVDGATSGALLRRIFRGLGAEPLIYVPDREREGYGPNPGAMQSLKDQGASLVITVDCGATAFEAIDAANALGLEVIILDHHVGADEAPNALAVVNPNRADETLAASAISRGWRVLSIRDRPEPTFASGWAD